MANIFGYLRGGKEYKYAVLVVLTLLHSEALPTSGAFLFPFLFLFRLPLAAPFPPAGASAGGGGLKILGLRTLVSEAGGRLGRGGLLNGMGDFWVRVGVDGG